jgi:hypothetical protein
MGNQHTKLYLLVFLLLLPKVKQGENTVNVVQLEQVVESFKYHFPNGGRYEQNIDRLLQHVYPCP